MKNIEFGVAASATQIEGRDIESTWHNFANTKSNINDGTSPKDGVDHLKHLEEDVNLIKSLKVKHYRMSLEWASIQPSKDTFDENVIEEYIKEIKLLKDAGINVMICFHHFTNPIWFEELGGWLQFDNMHFYLDYLKKVVPYFKDLVSEYLTFNEPSIYGMQSYFLGIWPPKLNKISYYNKVVSNMAYCHIKGREIILESYKDLDKPKISFAHSYGLSKGYKGSLFGSIVSKVYDLIANKYVILAFTKGIFRFNLKNIGKLKKGSYCDFIGLNYYSIFYFKGMTPLMVKDVPITDLNWIIYPKGIIISIERMLKIINKPIYITENGVCDLEDKFRIKYIYDHLTELINSKFNVERYYYWSFIDNFEWLEGHTPRFGLIHVDYETKVRTLKKSGLFFADLSENELDSPKILKYLEDQEYKRS